METQSTSASLEERRLALEEEKFRLEKSNSERDYEIKIRELNHRDSDGWFSRNFTPLTTTVAAGLIALIGSAIAALLQGQGALRLEESKRNNELLIKMVSVGDESVARRNLLFLVKYKLLNEEISKAIVSSDGAPVLFHSGAIQGDVAFKAIRSDDDAINLLLSWEGDFSSDPSVPGSASNGGISIYEMSSFLNRSVSVEEMRTLDRDVKVNFYKKNYLNNVSGLNSVYARATYLNISAMVGRGEAVKIMQASASIIIGKSLYFDGVLGPISIAVINDLPDQFMFIDTANCILWESLRKRSQYPMFGRGWIARIKAFSPASSKASCLEMAATPSVGGN